MSSNLGGTNLGGGINGISPKQSVTNYRSSENAMIRKQVVKSWNTKNATGTINGNKRIITPFRAVNNSGDFLSRKDYVCGGPNPNHLHRGGIRRNFRSMFGICDNTGVEAAWLGTDFHLRFHVRLIIDVVLGSRLIVKHALERHQFRPRTEELVVGHILRRV